MQDHLPDGQMRDDAADGWETAPADPALGDLKRRRLLLRVGVGVAGLCVFAAVASVIRPTPSAAGTDPEEEAERRAVAPSPAVAPEEAPERNAHGWALVGIVRGATHEAWVYGSPDGPRYTVVDQAGRIVVEEATADEVYRSVPEMDVKNMRLEPGAQGGPLMMADDRPGGY